MQRAQPPVQRLFVEVVGVGGGPRFGDRYPSADPFESPLDPGDVEQLEHRQPGNGAAIRADPAAPFDQVLAAAVGRHRLAAQLGRQLDDGVLRRADECAAEVDRGCPRSSWSMICRRPGHGPPSRRRRIRTGPGPAPRTAPQTLPRRRRRRRCPPSRERSSLSPTRLSRREGDDSAVRTHRRDRAGAGPPRCGGERGLHLRGTQRRLHAADPGVDRRRPRPDDQRRNRVSAQPDSSRPPGDRSPNAQRGPIRAGAGHADPHADREAVRRARSTSRWTG